MIPKVIHYCWFGGNPIPDEYKKYMESWKKFCPGYKIIEWNESNYDITKNKYMHEAYQAKKWAFVSDYARLDIIYNHGGVYLDTDVELLKNLDRFLEHKAFAGFASKKYVGTGLGFGAVKSHETIRNFRDYYDDVSFINKDGSYNLTACPEHQTKYLLTKGLKPNGKKQNAADIIIYPVDYFSPICYKTLKLKLTDNTFSIHHYSSSWLDDEGHRIRDFTVKLSRFLPGNAAVAISYMRYKGVWFVVRKICEKRRFKNQ